jgi:site-specific DNA-methyltransferase (adenine-specific)
MLKEGVHPDLVVTSPPYDTLRTYGGDRNAFTFDVFKDVAQGLYDILPDGGTVIWNVNDKTDGGSKTGTSFKQALYFMEVGFLMNDVMIFNKTNPMPQIRQCRYLDSFEYIFCFTKGTPKTFNPIMIPCKYAGRVYDSTAKNMGGENGRRKVNYIVNDEKPHNNVFDYAVSKNKTGHPAVFPYQLAYDNVYSWSNPNDLVYDPFMGSGTTAIAAIRLGRRYIGSELSEEYCDIARSRIKSETYNLL